MRRQGRGRFKRWLAGCLLLLVLGACRGIIGLHDVTYVPVDGACGTVVLPTEGDGRVRLVNAGTQGGSVDFCIRPSGTSDWGQPIFHAGPGSCDTGLAYATATIPFAVPAGPIDVEAIAAGSSCNAAASSQALGVPVGDSTAGASVMSLVRYGGGTNPESIATLPEEPTAGQSLTADYPYGLRLVNAISSGQPINAGFATSKALPSPVPEPLLPVPIAPGGVEPASNIVPGFRSFDAEGYSALIASVIDLGIVFQGQHDALFLFETPGVADVQTLYAIGDSADTTRPVQGILCEDGVPPGGGASLLATCTLSNLPSLTIDTFNTALYGADAPFNDERVPFVLDAIAARPSDLMCVVETAIEYDAIIKSASTAFPYSYFVPTNLDTQPTDPTDKNGNIPPPPAGPACAGIDPAIVQSIYQCVAQNCSSTGDMSGVISTTNCLSGACAGQFLQIYYQGPQQDACFDCITNSANSELPLQDGLTECTTDSRQPFGYGGMNATLILSKYPLTNTQAFILPGTSFRRAILYAQVTLEDQTVDFFCGHLISPLVDGVLPYVGNYGVDIPNQENGWQDEQDLQAQKAVPWMQATAMHPAIVAGDWHASYEATTMDPDGGSTTVLASQSPEVLALLDQSLGGAFVRAMPPMYTPLCEYCLAPQNVYNSGSNVHPGDFTTTYLRNFPANSTLADVQWGTDDIVPLSSLPYELAMAATGPISQYYGRQVRVLRPPVH